MKEKLKEVVEKLYDKGIDTLFVSDTSAVPYGYVIREAFKTAYSKPLKVLRIDVHELKELMRYRPFSYSKKKRELGKKAQEISNKLQKFKSKKLALFDECLDIEGNPLHHDFGDECLDIEGNPLHHGFGARTRKAYDLIIDSAPESKDIECREYCGVATFDREDKLYDALNFNFSSNPDSVTKIVTRGSPSLTRKGEQRRILKLIDCLKSFGKEIGEEIKKER